MVYITRRERFNAAHKLWRAEWTAEKNQEVFGKCANENWHGHNYELFITVKGEPDPETGFVLDLKDMSDIIKNEVVEALDHKNLNLDVAFMQGIMTSTENLAIKVWERLEPHLNSGRAQLHCVKIVETENNFVEYFGN
jgi:6-pyruvoyltetrahydropterin/6-carboxytetrahydropterin synthase